MDRLSDEALEKGWRGERIQSDDERGEFVLRRGVEGALRRWMDRASLEEPEKAMERVGRLERVFTRLGLREREIFDGWGCS